MKINSILSEQISAAAVRLKAGDLVAFPTETVYGLGADATNDTAVGKIFEVKRRPQFNPLIVHIPNMDMARTVAKFTPAAQILAKYFWPGPLTLVLPLKLSANLSARVTANLDSIALRIPRHPVAQNLLNQVGRPIAAPSANISGSVSATKASHVRDDFIENNITILDGGDAECGLESTIVGLIDKKISLLRLGAVDRASIEERLGTTLETSEQIGSRPNAPGQLASHYAPKARLRLDATEVTSDEALLAFGPNPLIGARYSLNLSPKGDLNEAAAKLFSLLRELDQSECETIAVMSVPDFGLGEAINDRLRRAAAPRPSNK